MNRTASVPDTEAGTGAAPERPRWLRVLRRTTALTTSAVLIVGVAGLTVAGRRLPADRGAEVGAVDVPVPSANIVYGCPAAPNNTLGAVDLGTTTSSTALTSMDAGPDLTYAGKALEDPATTLTNAEGGLLTVDPAGGRSRGAAGVVTTLTPDGDLRGLTAATCTPPSALSWIVGGSTALGSSAELRLTNPGSTSVTASVRLFGSVGEASLPAGGQVVVPAGTTMGVLLEAAGNDPRTVVSVEASGGTLLSSLVTESLDGETAAGTEVLTPGAAPSTDVTVPGVVLVEPADQGQSSGLDDTTGPESSDEPVVRVANPNETAASVRVWALGADGAEELTSADSPALVDPGAVFDIGLQGLPAGAYGVRVTSDVPVAAGVRLVRSAGESPERSGSLLHDVAWSQSATPDAGSAGTLAVPRGSGLSSEVVVTNTDEDGAVVTLTSPDGAWTQDVEVPALGTTTVDVPDDVAALRIAGDSSQRVTAATVVTAEVTGRAPGTLVAVVPAVADSSSLGERHLQLR